MASTVFALPAKTVPRLAEPFISHFFGIAVWIAPWLNTGEAEVRRSEFREDDCIAYVDPWLADKIKVAPPEDRDQLLDELLAISKGKTEGLQILSPVEGTMRYTVGSSSKPVDRAEQERKQRKGLVSDDRIRDLRRESLWLLNQVGGLHTVSEGQYVEFMTRWAKLRQNFAALSEELDQIEADLELVEFACEEAEERVIDGG